VSLITDKIVSVRMPKALVIELKEVASKNHYLDVSETIRSLLRKRWLEQKKPHKAKLNQIKQNLSGISDPKQLRALKQTIKLLEEINEIQ